MQSLAISWFEYDCELDLDQLNAEYTFDVSCQGTVPVAISCAIQANAFEEALRIGLYVGGDTDTVLAITGDIAKPLYGVPVDLREQAEHILGNHSQTLLGVVHDFEKKYGAGAHQSPNSGLSPLRRMLALFKGRP